MRTSFHHQPEAQHPNFQLSTRWSADYPIFRGSDSAFLRCPLNVRVAPQHPNFQLSTSWSADYLCNADVDLLVQSFDDLFRRALRSANAEPNCSAREDI
jgi:hypothetical protein